MAVAASSVAEQVAAAACAEPAVAGAAAADLAADRCCYFASCLRNTFLIRLKRSYILQC